MTAAPQAVTPFQRGRAEVDFIAAASGYANGTLRDLTREVFERESEGVDIPREFPARLRAIQSFMDDTPEWQVDQYLMRLVAEELAPTGIRSGVERGGARRRSDEDLPVDPNAVPINPDLKIPEYWDGVNFHASPHYLESPEWEYANDFNVIVKVFNRAGVAAVPKGSNTMAQRALAAEQITVTDVKRILDVGSGGGGAFMNAINDRFPDAQMYGVDLTARGLTTAKTMGKARGRDFVMRHESGDATSFEDNYFDVVSSYALLHEVPDETSIGIINEAFRVLRPGGQMMMVDVPPYREIEDFQFLIYDWETEGRVEPYWREAGLLDRSEVARQAGFVDVEEYPLGETKFPWILRATKPMTEEVK